jgi:putative oxidoreductase
MFRKLIATVPDGAIAVIRIVLGLVMLGHGLQKTFGLFGGYGFKGTMGFFTGPMHIPAVFAFLAIAAEFAGGLGLIVGLLGRVAAFGVAVNMAVAVILVHLPVGFFMNWNGNLKGEGYEYHLLAIAMAVAILLRGSGAASIDLALSRKR